MAPYFNACLWTGLEYSSKLLARYFILLRPIRITTVEVINFCAGEGGQSAVYKSVDLMSPRSISPHCRLWAIFVSMQTLDMQTKNTSDSVTVDYHYCMLKVIGNVNNYIYIRYKLNITILQQWVVIHRLLMKWTPKLQTSVWHINFHNKTSNLRQLLSLRYYYESW
jgi:hypothetical protein